MIKGYVLPATGVMTGTTIGAKLSVVIVLGGVTGIAIFGCAFINAIGVTGFALYVCMITC